MTTNHPIEFFIPGRRVRYVPGHALGPYDDEQCEDGTVSSHNGKNVFVKFDKQVRKFGWEGTTAQSCSLVDLWSNGETYLDSFNRVIADVKSHIKNFDCELTKCIHCGFPSAFLSSGLCHECIRLKLHDVEKLIMDAYCEHGTPAESYCDCASCCTKTALVLLTNKFANPKEKTE